MGIQTLVVFGGIALALGVGVLTPIWVTSMRTAALISLGLIALMGPALWLIERLLGRDIWHYHAPYPYRWMIDARTDAEPPTAALAKTDRRETAEHLEPLAAA